jgi:hypothetical protein
MRKLYIIILFVLVPIIPALAGAKAKGDMIFGLMLFAVLLAPYYGFGFLIFLLQRFSRRMENALSILIYLLCFVGIGVAYIHAVGGFNFNIYALYALDSFFFICALPFLIIICLEFLAFMKRKREKELDYFDSSERDI